MDVSVVIPTYNRSSTLVRALRGLAEQEASATWEVLVVDDGSTDDTAQQVRRGQADFPVPLHYYYQPNRKQGAARNLGARYARGRSLLFLGDDIVPGAGFLHAHWRRHGRRGEDGRAAKRAVIGRTAWPPEFEITPFLEYIGERGWQFGFALIDDPDDVPFNYFYTSNLSLDRAFFLEAGGFDENFKQYGWEDIELSVRLQDLGMQLVYEEQALAYHYHPTSMRSFIRRQQTVGFSAWYFYRSHPRLSDFLGIKDLARWGWRYRMKGSLLTWLCRLFENSSRVDLSSYYPDVMTYHYLRGLRRAKAESGT